MGYTERQQIIIELQNIRNTKIVTHINSDRRAPAGLPVPPGLNTKLGTEAQPFFYKVLKDIGKSPELDLYLYTGGGQTDSVWPLVSLFREFGEKFNVVVPYKSHSAGTLICLGANTIVMGEAAELSPIDPKTGNQFNPVDEIDKKMRRAISVEEVTSYFDLAKDPAKGGNDKESNLSSVDQNLAFKILAEKVHPLALGNVNRSHKQIRELAERLLEFHLVNDQQKARINTIVNELTQGRYSHTDILNRHEAQSLIGEDVVKNANESEQELLMKLLDEYVDAISMLKPYVIFNDIGSAQQAEINCTGAFIESENISYLYRARCMITQSSDMPPGYQIQLQPNQLLPLVPGLPKKIHFEIIEMEWALNKEGI